jgi:hypothetical protein
MRKKENQEQSDSNFFSPTLITNYSGRAISFINSIERFLFLLLPFLILFALVILFDMVALKNYIPILSDDIFDLLASIFAFVAVGIIVYLLKIIIKIRKKMDNWAYIFEKNTIGTSISISLSKLESIDLLHAIVENVREIGEPIQKYISNDTKSIERFIHQNFSDDIFFDILIDDSRIDKDTDENIYFKNKINEYGSIIGKIQTSSVIDSNTVNLFIQSILKYVKVTSKFVGLALLVGNEVTDEAMKIVTTYSNKHIGYLIVIEKPVVIDSVQ